MKILEILQLAKKELLDDQKECSGTGLCTLVNNFETLDQELIYMDYLDNNFFTEFPKKFNKDGKLYGTNPTDIGKFSFHHKDYESRLKWLDKHIKLNS